MPRVNGLLPRELGMDWKQYLEYGYDEYSKNADSLWQPGPFDTRDRPKDLPENVARFPSYCWGPQFP
eukprot:2528374-Alexandrium_andersonii.AAC.1